MPAGASAAADLATALWQRLDPGRWPLPLASLPGGSALVGGAVRDGLLGRLHARPDLDLVVPPGAIALCRQLARRFGGSAVVLDDERDIARLVLRGWSFDLAAWDGGSLASDLLRRDYSINAIALPLQAGSPLLDPTGGLACLAQRSLVAISEANLRSDPLRLLRGLRLACELEFAIAPQTLNWIQLQRHALAQVAGERVLAELEKLACAPGGEAGLAKVLDSGLLQPWLTDEPPLDGPLTRLSVAAADALGLNLQERSWALPLARLSCLVGTEGLQRLRSSRALQQRVKRLRQHWQQLAGRSPLVLPEAERFGLQRELEADLPALLLLGPAGSGEQALLQRWRDADDPLCHPRSPLDGRRLQQLLGLPPGPLLGQLLLHLSRERAFGRLGRQANDGEVIAAANRWLDRRRD